MTKLELVAVIALIGMGFVGFARADVADDVARAEREINLRRIAKGIFERADKRAWDAVKMSSLYKRYEVAAAEAINCPAREALSKKKARSLRELDHLRRELRAAHSVCVKKMHAAWREVEVLVVTLRAQFVEEEVSRHLERLRNDAERQFLRKEIERLSI